MKIPPLQNILAFIQVVESGQLRAAAKNLNITESAVSHQLSRLEQQLGVRLLERGSKGVELTQHGKRFYARTNPAISEIDFAVKDIHWQSHNRISITMPQSFAAMWFSQRLYRLVEDHLDIEIDILPTRRVCDLKREGIDFGIRMKLCTAASELVAPLVQETISPVCTVENAKKIETIGWEKFLLSENVARNAIHMDEWEDWGAAYGMKIPNGDKTITLSSFDLVVNAVTSGFGIAMGRTPLVDAHLHDGLLKRPFPDMVLKTDWYVLATSHEQPLRGALRRFSEWLLAEMNSDESGVSGV